MKALCKAATALLIAIFLMLYGLVEVWPVGLVAWLAGIGVLAYQVGWAAR